MVEVHWLVLLFAAMFVFSLGKGAGEERGARRERARIKNLWRGKLAEIGMEDEDDLPDFDPDPDEEWNPTQARDDLLEDVDGDWMDEPA